MNILRRAAAILILLPCGLMANDHTQDEKDPEKSRNQKVQNAYQQQAEEYVMTEESNDTLLTLEPEPVFNWLNKARVGAPQTHKGAVFVWTRDGRAEVVGTIFSVDQNKGDYTFYHEFHSLATGPLKATVKRSLRWNTSDAGVAFTSFPGTEVPAETRALRLAEARKLARRFTGYSINYDDARWELSLLPQPLYRMPKANDEILDQAVFALISTAGTDPEVLLVIEARKVGSAFQWQYSVCRFTDLKTFVSLDGTDVWSFKNGTKGAYNEAGLTNRYRLLGAETIRFEE